MKALHVAYNVSDLPPHILITLLNHLVEIFAGREHLTLGELMKAGYDRPIELVELGWVSQGIVNHIPIYRPTGELAERIRCGNFWCGFCLVTDPKECTCSTDNRQYP